MKIRKGMEVYLSDEIVKLNEMFVKKNGPYVVQNVFTEHGVEMARLLVKDSSYIDVSNCGTIIIPTSKLYTKNTNADEFMPNCKSTTKPEEIKYKYVYELDNGKTVASEERLRMDENILVSDDKTNKYYISSVASYEIKLMENDNPDLTFVMSMDAVALNEALEWKILSNNEKTKEVVKKELCINTLNDLNKYDFITYKKLETILLDKLTEITGQPEIVNVFKSVEAKEIINKAVEKLAKEMGYMKMNKVTWLYYKREEQIPISAARIISSMNKTE